MRYRSRTADSARWAGFPFRNGDIVISTPPKCGTTWTQMICAELIFQTPHFDQPLAKLSPYLDSLTNDRDELVAVLEAQTHRRFIKTHTPLDGLPLDDRVSYICIGRDPRDVGFSWAAHNTNVNLGALFAVLQKKDGLDDLLPEEPQPSPASEMELFWQWVEGTVPVTQSLASLAALFHHLRTFWPARAGASNLILIHYDDLQADLKAQMRYLAERLGIQVPEQRWPELVSGAQFHQMRRRAKELAPNTGAFLHDNTKFFRRGTSGQWREHLNQNDLLRYNLRIAELDDPQIARWAHRDPPAK